MPSQEGSQQSVVLEAPNASSSPLLSQMTPSTHQDRDRPIIRLIPPPPFNSTGAHSFAPSSSTSVSTMPTPRLKLADQHIKTLSSSIIALRTNSAHYLLQHKILEMETTEAAARHQVESEITRREVEVLRLDQSSFSTTQQLALAEENEAYKRRLRKAKRSIKNYRDELGDFKDENERLKKRIRDNRQHQLDASRSPDARHVTAGGVERSAPARRVGGAGGRGTAEDDGLEALRLLASQVLSQEIDEDTCYVDAGRVTTPQPKLKKPTTSDSTHNSIRRTLMSPVAFTSSSASRSKKRRHSRDSTISASDIDASLDNDDK
ncbi:uncharacterized protein LAJ45_02099 [Morchella importuna]|uniref:uncharacterized protein n=1 Tax=Morchella importuna TaxID=1174673 RepID=UPI001E8D2441|nr:uncharacterized protein LAJ45_02099 [Morchella importuna]KAH8154331.1 hypothetical protein LAJ45_02099 [Morchella importuna]